MVRLYRYNGGTDDLLSGSRGGTWPAKQAWFVSREGAESAKGTQRDILTLVALRLYKCYDSVDNVIQELLSYE